MYFQLRIACVVLAVMVAGQTGAFATQEKNQDNTSGKTESGAGNANSDERQVILEDKFDDRKEVGEAYTLKETSKKGWTIENGVLVGQQVKDNHGVVIRRNHAFSDIDLEIDFRFSGGTRFNFVLDDQNEKSVHSSHICRVSISPKQLYVRDDKTGSMNLKVRAQRKEKNLPEKKATALEALLEKTQSRAKIKLERDKWYRLRIQIEGNQLSASIDGNHVTCLNSPGIGHATKTKFGMTVNGSSIDFDNLVVYSTTPLSLQSK